MNSQPLSRPKNKLTQSQVKWGVLFYVACLAVVGFMVPQEILTYILSPEKWSPSRKLFAFWGESLIVTPFAVIPIVILIIFLAQLYGARNSLNMRRMGLYILVRVICVGLTLFVFIQSERMRSDAVKLFDAISDKSLAQLQTGMSRESVEKIILGTNVASITKSLSGGPTGNSVYYNEKEKEVEDAWNLSQKGHPADFTKLKFDRTFFNLNDRSSSKIDPEHRSVFVKLCCGTFFGWKRYDLFIEYDDNMKLKSAKYLKSPRLDAKDTACRVRLEIPASKDKVYPYPCPADVQEF